MDDYLSKPVLIDVLRQTLQRWLPSANAVAPAAQTGKTEPSALPQTALPTLDVSVLARLIGDERALIAEFLHDFAVAAGAAASEVRSAQASASWKQVGAIAHQLKSSSRSVGALALGEICAALEQAGKSDRGDLIVAQLPAFDQALSAVLDAIERHIKQGH